MLKDPKKAVVEMASRVGTTRARDLLMDAKVKRSTAEKLAGGRYPSAVGFELHLKIDKALAAAALEKQTA